MVEEGLSQKLRDSLFCVSSEIKAGMRRRFARIEQSIHSILQKSSKWYEFSLPKALFFTLNWLFLRFGMTVFVKSSFQNDNFAILK